MKNKKNIKWILAAILGIALIFFISTSITSNNAVLGDWELISLQQGDKEISGSDLTDMYNGTITYSFEKQGVLIVSMMDQEIEGSYEVNGKQITVTYNGIESIFELDGDEMLIVDNGLIFTIQKQD